MAKKSSVYWQKRFSALENAQNQYGQNTFHQIEPAFDKAERQIQAQIEAWYARYASNNGITLAEARKQLSAAELKELQWDVQEYIKYGQENAMNQQWMKELENASARFHISRLEALKLRTQQSLEVAFGNELDSLDGMVKRLYQSGYYHTCFEVQKGFNIGWEIGQIDERKLQKVISKPWAADGKTFSDRVWQSKTTMVNELHQQMTRTIIQGKAPDEAIKSMTKYLQNKTKNAKYNAGRLVMTEQAFISSAAQKDAFNDLDVEEFEIVATLDSHTSDICREMDGKHFPMKDFQPGVTAPPFHVWCRSTTVPYFDDEWGRSGERAARGEDGKTYYVPADMTYPEWEKAMVDGQTDDLKPAVPDGIIKSKKETIQTLDKLKQSGIPESEYDEYLGIINNHENPDIIKLYKHHADEITKVKKTNSGSYSPVDKSLVFDYPKYDDMNKYGTLAHEYGHFFDAEVKYEGLHFNEIQAVQNATGLNAAFKEVASSSDEFLAAIRKDKEHIRSIYTTEAKADLIAHNASSGVQDAIDGLFPKSRIRWGHGERYYNRKYADIEFMDKLSSVTSRKKKLQQVYKDLGLDASNQAKVKTICRQYEAASEAWANIMSAEVCGGEALEYVKKYLPNSYAAMLDILKGVK